MKRRIGFWSAILTAVLAASAFVLGITTPARSGPNCLTSCITYPYTKVAAFVPGDYLWMYPALLVALAFVILVAFIHSYAPEDKKTFGRIGLSFAIIAAVALATDYFIQLTVVQPSLLKGETEGLSLFSEYNPHGIFIALEDLGYLVMGVAFLFAGMAFAGRARLERAVRWVFVVGGIVAIGALIALSLIYGSNLEYRFEVAGLATDWTVLIVSGSLLAVLFGPARNPDSS